MTRIIILVLSILLFSNCDNNKKQIKDIIDSKLKELNIVAEVKVTDSKEFKEGDVILSFKKPYRVTGKDIQDDLVAYLSFLVIKKLELKGKIRFQYFLEYEINKKVLINSFSYQDFERSPLDKETYIKLLEYSLKNFESEDDFWLSKNIEILTKTFPTVIENDDLFKLLYELSLNKNPNIDFNADRLIILFYSYDKYLLEEKIETDSLRILERKIEMKHLEKFWEIAKGTDINLEKDFIKKVDELIK